MFELYYNVSNPGPFYSSLVRNETFKNGETDLDVNINIDTNHRSINISNSCRHIMATYKAVLHREWEKNSKFNGTSLIENNTVNPTHCIMIP